MNRRWERGEKHSTKTIDYDKELCNAYEFGIFSSTFVYGAGYFNIVSVLTSFSKHVVSYLTSKYNETDSLQRSIGEKG